MLSGSQAYTRRNIPFAEARSLDLLFDRVLESGSQAVPLRRYRITDPTIALFEEDGRHVARTVPEGAIIRVDTSVLDGDRLTDVTWNNKKVMMFTLGPALQIAATRLKGRNSKALLLNCSFEMSDLTPLHLGASTIRESPMTMHGM